MLTPAAEGMPGAVCHAEEITKSSSQFFMPQQFRNPANPEVVVLPDLGERYLSTGLFPE